MTMDHTAEDYNSCGDVHHNKDGDKNNTPCTNNDMIHHNDDDFVASKLSHTVRVICWVVTSRYHLHKRAIYVKNTWGKRCNKLLFMSDKEDKDFPAVGLSTSTVRLSITMKTVLSFQYIYEHHLDDADWFLKADVDTYVIMENLRYLLSKHNTFKPVYFGPHFKVDGTSMDYFSGGGGYILSKEALIRFGRRPKDLCGNGHGAKDHVVASCMAKLDVVSGNARPGNDGFPLSPVHPPYMLRRMFPKWYIKFDQDNTQEANPRDYPISFHYSGREKMLDMEYFTYNLSVYGINQGTQELN